MNREIADYFKTLGSEGVPSFIKEYACTQEMVRLKGIGLLCGTDYSKIYNHRYFYSRYEHSIAVAMIIWHFSGQKEQALAGLFHDIASPVFSHSVDFMNGDALTQSSTEKYTSQIIKNAAQITELLSRDHIDLCKVEDYHLYPIADNDSPKLSADRLEYTLSTMMVWHDRWNLNDIEKLFRDLTVLKNEHGNTEIGFSTIEEAEKFVKGSCLIGKTFQQNENKLSLSLLGDILKMAMSCDGLTIDDIYSLTESQVIEKLKNSSNKRIQKAWQNYSQLHEVHGSDEMPNGCYCVKTDTKKRYINPLVKYKGDVKRVTDVSSIAKRDIQDFLSYKDKPVAYADFSL